MFNDKYGLTNAVLQGTKMMTRRLCKEYATNEVIPAKDVESWLYTPDENIVEFVMENGEIKVSKPPYKPGEVVAVAMSYQTIEKEIRPLGVPLDLKENIEKHKGYTNKMFVKPSDMPHQIMITDIKVERLQNISDEDCMNEGVLWDYDNFTLSSRKVYLINDYEEFPTPRAAFASLINRVCGKSTWESNPYVFAYTFELIK